MATHLFFFSFEKTMKLKEGEYLLLLLFLLVLVTKQMGGVF